MLIWLIGVFAVVLLLHFFYFKVHLTKQRMLEYKQLFEKAGFRVKLEPFRLFTSRMFEIYKEGEQTYGNPLHYKQNDLVGYDVVVCSFLNRPMLQLISPDLLQAYFMGNDAEFHKFRPLFRNL